MAVRILPYEQQTTVRGSMEPVRVPVDQSAGAFANAIGGAFKDAGQVLDAMDERDSKMAAAAAFSQREIDEQANFQNASAQRLSNPTGFGKDYTEDFDKRNTEFLGQYSGRTRMYLQQMTTDLRTRYGQEAVGYEARARRASAATDLNTAIDNTAASVYSGSITPEEGKRRAQGILDAYDKSGVGDIGVSEKARASIGRDMTYYGLQRQIQNDPGGALRRMGVNPSAAPVKDNAVAKSMFQYFAQKYGSIAAAAIVGNAQQESSFNVNAVHDGGTGYGIMGFRDPTPGQGRMTDLKNFAAEHGLDPSVAETQYAFIDHELNTTEKTAGDQLRAAKTLDEANRAMIGYERPRGWSAENPEAGDSYTQRLAYAKGALDAFGGDNANLAPSPELADLPPDDLIRARGQAESQLRSQRAEYRATFEQDVSNDLATYAQGGTVQNPKTAADFFKAYAPDEAVVKFNEYTVAGQTNIAMAGFKGSTNAQIMQTVDDMRPTPGTPDYAERVKSWQTAAAGAQQVLTQRVQDPAGYVQNAMPNVRDAWTNYANGSTTLGDTIRLTQSAQTSLGIPDYEQQAVPKSVRTALIRGVQSLPPQQAYQQMQQWSQMGDKTYTALMHSLGTGENALSRDYQTLSTISDPVAGTAYAEALELQRTKGVSARETAIKTFGDKAVRSMDETVQGKMVSYGRTLAYQGAGTLVNQQVDAASMMTYMMASKLSSADAAQRAVDALTSQYDIIDNPGRAVARAPKGLGSMTLSASSFVLSTLNPESLRPRGGDPNGVAEDTKNMLNGAYWVTSPKYDGWTLVGGAGNVIQLKDGTPVQLRFADVPGYAILREQRDKDIYTPLPTQQGQTPGDVEVQEQIDARPQ